MSIFKGSRLTPTQARVLLVSARVCGVSAVIAAFVGLVHGCVDSRILVALAGGVLLGYAERLKRAMAHGTE